jgi:hypothetical protein
MLTAVGLRFLRTLARLGEDTPAYVEPGPEYRHRHVGRAHSADMPHRRPAAPSIRPNY